MSSPLTDKALERFALLEQAVKQKTFEIPNAKRSAATHPPLTRMASGDPAKRSALPRNLAGSLGPSPARSPQSESSAALLSSPTPAETANDKRGGGAVRRSPPKAQSTLPSEGGNNVDFASSNLGLWGAAPVAVRGPPASRDEEAELASRAASRNMMRRDLRSADDRRAPGFKYAARLRQQLAAEFNLVGEANAILDSKSAVAGVLHAHMIGAEARQTVALDIDHWSSRVVASREFTQSQHQERLAEMDTEEEVGNAGETAVQLQTDAMSAQVKRVAHLGSQYASFASQAMKAAELTKKARVRTVGVMTDLTFGSDWGLDGELNEPEFTMSVPSLLTTDGDHHSPPAVLVAREHGIEGVSYIQVPSAGNSRRPSEVGDMSSVTLMAKSVNDAASERPLNASVLMTPKSSASGRASRNERALHAMTQEMLANAERRVKRRNETIQHLLRTIEKYDRDTKRRRTQHDTEVKIRERQILQLKVYLEAIESGAGFTTNWTLDEENTDIERFIQQAMENIAKAAETKVQLDVAVESGEVSDAKKKITELSSDNVDVSKLLEEKSDLQSRLKAMRREMLDLKKELDNKDEIISDRDEAVRRVQGQMRTLQVICDALNGDVTARDATIHQLHAEVAKLRAAANETQTVLVLEAQRTELQNQQQMDDLMHQIADLRRDVENTDTAMENRIRLKAGSLINKVQSLEENLKLVSQLLSAMERRASDLESRLKESAASNGDYFTQAFKMLMDLSHQCNMLSRESDVDTLRASVWQGFTDLYQLALSTLGGFSALVLSFDGRLGTVKRKFELLKGNEKQNTLLPTSLDTRTKQLAEDLQRAQGNQEQQRQRIEELLRETQSYRDQMRLVVQGVKEAVDALLRRHKTLPSPAQQAAGVDEAKRISSICNDAFKRLGLDIELMEDALHAQTTSRQKVSKQLIAICDQSTSPMSKLLAACRRMCFVLRQVSRDMARLVEPATAVARRIDLGGRETASNYGLDAAQASLLSVMLSDVNQRVPSENARLIRRCVCVRAAFESRIYAFRRIFANIHETDDIRREVTRRQLSHVERHMFLNMADAFEQFASLHERRLDRVRKVMDIMNTAAGSSSMRRSLWGIAPATSLLVTGVSGGGDASSGAPFAAMRFPKGAASPQPSSSSPFGRSSALDAGKSGTIVGETQLASSSVSANGAEGRSSLPTTSPIASSIIASPLLKDAAVSAVQAEANSRVGVPSADADASAKSESAPPPPSSAATVDLPPDVLRTLLGALAHACDGRDDAATRCVEENVAASRAVHDDPVASELLQHVWEYIQHSRLAIAEAQDANNQLQLLASQTLNGDVEGHRPTALDARRESAALGADGTLLTSPAVHLFDVSRPPSSPVSRSDPKRAQGGSGVRAMGGKGAAKNHSRDGTTLNVGSVADKGLTLDTNAMAIPPTPSVWHSHTHSPPKHRDPPPAPKPPSADHSSQTSPELYADFVMQLLSIAANEGLFNSTATAAPPATDAVPLAAARHVPNHNERRRDAAITGPFARHGVDHAKEPPHPYDALIDTLVNMAQRGSALLRGILPSDPTAANEMAGGASCGGSRIGGRGGRHGVTGAVSTSLGDRPAAAHPESTIETLVDDANEVSKSRVALAMPVAAFPAHIVITSSANAAARALSQPECAEEFREVDLFPVTRARGTSLGNASSRMREALKSDILQRQAKLSIDNQKRPGTAATRFGSPLRSRGDIIGYRSLPESTEQPLPRSAGEEAVTHGGHLVTLGVIQPAARLPPPHAMCTAASIQLPPNSVRHRPRSCRPDEGASRKTSAVPSAISSSLLVRGSSASSPTMRVTADMTKNRTSLDLQKMGNADEVN